MAHETGVQCELHSGHPVGGAGGGVFKFFLVEIGKRVVGCSDVSLGSATQNVVCYCNLCIYFGSGAQHTCEELHDVQCRCASKKKRSLRTGN